MLYNLLEINDTSLLYLNSPQWKLKWKQSSVFWNCNQSLEVYTQEHTYQQIDLTYTAIIHGKRDGDNW